MESSTPAPIWIVGVGPGDPELLTIKAARVLASCETILHAGPENDTGFAIEVVAPLLRPDQTIRGMALAMKRGPDDGSVGYERVARALVDESATGRPSAFLTEGDPMLYGSGSYVADRVRTIDSSVQLEIIPGVSAMGAVAAKLGWPLARKEEILTVCPATYHAADLESLLNRGPVCFLKASAVLPILVEALRRAGRLHRAVVVERLGRADERIYWSIEEAAAAELSYFSLVLVR
jgi:precorrin-2/cobalt-factor-2 C20-methyltransferase